MIKRLLIVNLPFQCLIVRCGFLVAHRAAPLTNPCSSMLSWVVVRPQIQNLTTTRQDYRPHHWSPCLQQMELDQSGYSCICDVKQSAKISSQIVKDVIDTTIWLMAAQTEEVLSPELLKIYRRAEINLAGPAEHGQPTPSVLSQDVAVAHLIRTI